jgi:hypothetical protein
MVARIEKLREGEGEQPVFIHFQGNQVDRVVEVHYYSTDGNIAARVKRGDKFNGTDLRGTAVTDFFHKGAKRERDRLDQLRHLILSRGRIVTRADISSACSAFFGDEIDSGKTIISRTAKLSPYPHNGLVECIDVTVIPSGKESRTQDEWNAGAKQLASYLQRNSSGILPFEVRIAGFRNI